MNEYKIITNNHRRNVLGDWNLTADEKEEFEYIDWGKCERGEDSVSFVHYRGVLYDLNDIDGNPGQDGIFTGWNAYVSDSFFSGTVFRYVEVDGDFYIVCGRYYG